MMFSTRSERPAHASGVRCVWLAAAIALAPMRLAYAADASAPREPVRAPPADGDDDTVEVRRARELFQEGRQRYDLGEYEGAADAFKQAYKLWPQPSLLLNLAQAHRLAGDCRRALALYRSFLRKGTRDDELRIAGEHERSLTARCDQTVSPSKLSGRAIVAASLVAVGVAAGATAAGMLIWNEGRASTWRREDAELQRVKAAGMPPTTELQQRQDDNDALSRRIGRTDRAAAFVAVGAGLALLAGGTLALIESRAARLRVDGETVGVAVSF